MKWVQLEYFLHISKTSHCHKLLQRLWDQWLFSLISATEVRKNLMRAAIPFDLCRHNYLLVLFFCFFYFSFLFTKLHLHQYKRINKETEKPGSLFFFFFITKHVSEINSLFPIIPSFCFAKPWNRRRMFVIRYIGVTDSYNKCKLIMDKLERNMLSLLIYFSSSVR